MEAALPERLRARAMRSARATRRLSDRPRSTWWSWRTTPATRCARASSRWRALPWVDVTVVDNACPEDSSRVVEDLPVRIVRSPRNGGFAYGCNLGMANGSAEFVLLLNPDAEIDAASLAVLVDALRADPSLAGIGPRPLTTPGT